MTNVFISYGRRDAKDFAERLAADLETNGHHVWMDRSSIELGERFDARIEQGIRGASVVLAVMSARSVEPDSVCRDEIVYAINSRKTVVPIRTTTDPRVSTLLLVRRQWLDFTSDYPTELGALLRFLAGDAAGLRTRVLPLVALDFAPEIARLAANFTGRSWFTAELDHWIARSKKRALVVLAPPGFGKSAIAASLAGRADVLAIHFCIQQDTRSLDPQELVMSLAAQLAVRLPEYLDAVVDAQPELARPTGSDAFRDLIVLPTRKLADPGSIKLVVIDALDEADGRAGESIVDVLSAQAPDLPPWLRLVVTSRAEASVLDRIRHLDIHELLAARPENLADLRSYIDARIQRVLPSLPPEQRTAAAARLDELANGLFLYARLTLDALEDAELDVDEIGELLPGLAHVYTRAFNRLAAKPDRAKEWPFTMRVLRALVAAREAVPLGTLSRAWDVDREAVHAALLDLRAFLIRASDREPRFALFHKSLQDWLVDPEAAGRFWCDDRAGHEELGRACLREYDGGAASISAYALAHVVSHLCAAGQTEKLADLLLDFDFVNAKISRMSPQALLDDFRQARVARGASSGEPDEAMTSLERALLLSSDALTRDPSQLAAQLLGRIDDDASQSLRAIRRRATARDGDWLRPLRASLFPPDGPLLRSVRLHGGRSVTAIRITADGVRAISCGFDDRVVLWNLVTGRIEHELGSHRGGVRSLAISPDQRIAVSGGNDKRVKIWDLMNGTLVGSLRHAGPVAGVALTPDGRHGVSVCADGQVKLWDLSSRIIAQVDVDDLLWSVAVSADGQHVLAGSRTGVMRAWRTRDLAGEGEWQSHDRGKDVDQIVCDDQDLCFSSGGDGRIRAWRVPDGELLLDSRWGERRVGALAILPDRRLAAGDVYGNLALFDPRSVGDASVHSAHRHEIRTIAVVPHRDLLLTGSADAIRQWSISRLRSNPIPRVHDGVVWSVAIAPGGRAVTSARGALGMWSLEDGTLLRKLPLSFRPDSVHVSADGTAAVCRDSKAVFVVSLLDGSVLCENRERGDSLLGPAPRFIGDSRYVVVADGETTTLFLWDVTSNEIRAAIDCPAEVIAFEPVSPDKIVIATKGRGLLYWEPSLDRASPLIAHGIGDVGYIRWRDGVLLLGSERMLTVRTPEGAAIRTFDLGTNVDLRTFDTDGTTAVFAMTDGSPRLVWRDLVSERELSFDTDDPIECVALSTDGQTVIAGDWAGSVHVLTRESAR